MRKGRHGAMALTGDPPVLSWRSLPRTRLLVLASLGSLALPTLVSVARRYWSTAEGSQGPLVLVTAAWLLWRSRGALAREAAPLSRRAWPFATIPLALLYAFGRAYGSLPIETVALYAIGLLTAFIYFGPATVRRHWFLFAYPAFLIVMPPSVATMLTQPLRLSISSVSVQLLHLLGYPVALSGATIQIAQYALLVKTACAGLGSMFTLSAAGLLYVHLRRDRPAGHALALVLLIIPVAIFANLARVMILALLTWYAGSAVAEGIAHESAGLLMFSIAMGVMFLIDTTLGAAGWLRGRGDG